MVLLSIREFLTQTWAGSGQEYFPEEVMSTMAGRMCGGGGGDGEERVGWGKGREGK